MKNYWWFEFEIFKMKKRWDLSLDTRMKSGEERMFRRESQNSFFSHCAFDIIILKNDVFFEDFDSVDFVGALQLGQHDFAEASFTQHFDEMELFQAQFFAFSSAFYKRI